MTSQNTNSEFELEELGDITSEASEGETDDLLSDDSENELYSDQDEFEDYEVSIDSPQLTPTRSQTPLDLSSLELDKYREEWQRQLDHKSHALPTASSSQSSSIFQRSETSDYPTFVEPHIISEILSYLNILDLCQLRLVASIFSMPIRAIIYKTIYLISPQQTLKFFELVQLDPSIGEFIEEVVITLGSIDAVITELPIVLSKGTELRRFQDAQENEWFYENGRSTHPASIKNLTSREGSQKWEEDIKLAIGSRASCTDIELYRRQLISKLAITAIVSDPQDFEEAQRQINSVYDTYPFESQEGSTPTLHFNFLQLLAETYWIPRVEKLSIHYLSTIYTDLLLLFFSPKHLSLRPDIMNRRRAHSDVPQLLHPYTNQQTTNELLVREDGQGLIGNIAKVQYLKIHDCALRKIDNDSIKFDQHAHQKSRDHSWNLIECTFDNVSVDFDLSTDTTSWDLHLFLGQNLTRFQKSPYLTKLDLTSVNGFSYDSIVDLIYFHAHHLQHIALRNINSDRPVQLNLDDQLSVVATTRKTSSTLEETSWLSGSLVMTGGKNKGKLEWYYNKKGNPVNDFLCLTSEQLFSEVEFESIPWEELGRKSTVWSRLKQASGDSIARFCTTTIGYELSLCSKLETLILRGSDDSSSSFPLEITDALFELEIQHHNLINVDVHLGVKKQSRARWNDLVGKLKVVNSGILGREGGNENQTEVCSVRFGATWDEE